MRIPDDSIGLTDTCREALRSATQPLTITQLEDAVEALGYSLADQKSAAATLNTVMVRLAAKGEAESVNLTPERLVDDAVMRSVHAKDHSSRLEVGDASTES